MLIFLFVCFDWILYNSVNSISVISGQVFMGLTSTKQRINCLAQGHNAVALVRIEHVTPRSRVKHFVKRLHGLS